MGAIVNGAVAAVIGFISGFILAGLLVWSLNEIDGRHNVAACRAVAPHTAEYHPTDQQAAA